MKHRMHHAEIATVVTSLSLFLILTAPAAPVPEREAVKAVAQWLRSDNAPLGTHLGQRIDKTVTFSDREGNAIYSVVYLAPAGFVVVSADDSVEPIIAFAAQGRYDPSTNNPLGALVSADLPGRQAKVNAMKRSNATPLMRTAKRKWARLTESTNSSSGMEMGTQSISDVRVPPLVQSRWNQQTVSGSACYNYYTPPHLSGSADNYPCGCVATAMAQLMRFHQHPVNGVGTASFSIKVDEVSQNRKLRGGDGAGGAYAWGSMPMAPSNPTTAERQAIGSLTADAGVSVNMEYAADGSGTDTLKAKNAFVDVFGYANAIKGWNGGGTLSAGLDAMANANLDAGYPVLLGISGPPGGHAIACDGYGYNSSTLYHHLNLGWSGTDDAWYDLPTIDTGLGTFSAVSKCVYNVYVAGAGEIISGRVTDASGTPVSGVTVTATRTGGGTYTASSNTRGIYALAKIPPASTYTIAATKPGYAFAARTISTGTSIDNSAASGNCWGIDFSSATDRLTVLCSGTDSTVVELSPSAIGDVTGVIAPCYVNYPGATLVTLTAAVSSASTVFSTWSGVDSQSGRTAKVFMNGNRTVTATYVRATAQPGDNVSIYSITWSDTSNSGDGDGIIEGWEDVALKISLKSTEAIENVRGVLSSSVVELDIKDAEDSWPDIAANAVVPCDGDFNLYLKRDSYTDLPLTLRVDYDKNGLPYYQNLLFTKSFVLQGSRAASFAIIDYVVDDSPGYSTANNGNGVFESGERVRIRPRLKNIGNANATHVNTRIAWTAGGGIQQFDYWRLYDDLATGEEGYPLNGDFYTIRADSSFCGTAGIDFVVKWNESQNPQTNAAGFNLSVACTPWLNAQWQAGGTDHSFGFVAPGTLVTNNISVQNTGSAELTVYSIVTNAPDLGIVGTTFPLNIPAGQTVVVASVLDTTGLNASVIRTLTVQSNGRRTTNSGLTNAVTLLLSGTATTTAPTDMVSLATMKNAYHLLHGTGHCDGSGDLNLVTLTRGRLGADTTPTLYVYKKNGDNQFVEQWNSGDLFANYNVSIFAASLAVGDVNGDGKDDIVVAMYQSRTDLGNGKLFFLENTGPNAWTVTWSGYTSNGRLLDVLIADSDGDGRKEVILTSHVWGTTTSSRRGRLYVIENNGAASFSEIFQVADLPGDGTGENITSFSGVTVVDSDRDGRPEIIFGAGHEEVSWSGAGNNADQLYIYESTGDNAFAKRFSGLSYNRTHFEPWDHCTIAVADLDNDGLNELVLGEDGNNQVWVWQISGNDSWASDVTPTTFEFRTPAMGAETTCLLVGNLDSDAHKEFVVGTDGGIGVNLALYDSFAADSYVQQWSTVLPHDIATISSANTDSSGLPRILISVRNNGLYIMGEQPQPTIDLYVSGANILATPPPVEGQPTTLAALVGNSMAGTASNLLVRFFAGDPAQGAPQIGSNCIIPRISGNSATNASVSWTPGLEGIATVFVQVDPTNGLREASTTNNTASRAFLVGDSDTEPPVISLIQVSELNGDGDNVIGTDEDAQLSLVVSDESGIASGLVILDDSAVWSSGPFASWSINMHKLSSGTHKLEIRVADTDVLSPASRTNWLIFDVVQAERIAVQYNNSAVTNGQSWPVDLGVHALGTAPVPFFVLENQGQQSLFISNLTVSGSFTASGPLTQNVGPLGLTSFEIRPLSTTLGNLTGVVTIASSDRLATPFSFPVRARIVLEPPRFTAVSVIGQFVHLSFKAPPNSTCRLEWSTHFSSWTLLETLVVDSTGLGEAFTPMAATGNRLFYRISLP